MLHIYAMRKRQIKTSMRYYYPSGSDSKKCADSAGDLGLIPGWKDPLEKGVATHSCIFAWKIP